MENRSFITKAKRLFEAYEAFYKPYCEEVGLAVKAFEILLTIANNKEIITANDICKKQNIKPTLMSFHVEKLVQAGLIERQPIAKDRRSIRLVCTEKAEPIVKKGIELNKKCSEKIKEGITAEEIEVFNAVLEKIDRNAEKILKDKLSEEGNE